MNKKDREHLFQLLSLASRIEAHRQRRRSRKGQGFLLRNYHWIFQIVPMIFAVVLAFVVKFIDKFEPARFFSLAFLLAAYLATFVYPFILAWVQRQAISRAAREPFSILLENMNQRAAVDTRLLSRLACSPIEHLELLLLELKAEREYFERRIALIVGSIDKIGLFPGFVAAFLTIISIKEKSLPAVHGSAFSYMDWIALFAYAIPFMYFLGIIGHFLMMRLDRQMKIVELALARKKGK